MLCLYNYERFTLNTFLAISLCFVPFSLADKYFSTIFCAQISSLCKCWRFGMKLIKLKNVTMNRVAPENCSKSNFSFILLSITSKDRYLVFVLIMGKSIMTWKLWLLLFNIEDFLKVFNIGNPDFKNTLKNQWKAWGKAWNLIMTVRITFMNWLQIIFNTAGILM